MFRSLKLKQKVKMDSVAAGDPACALHSEKLQLFCLVDKQLVCLVCRDSEKHVNHTFRPIGEAVSSYKVSGMSFLSFVMNDESFTVSDQL